MTSGRIGGFGASFSARLIVRVHDEHDVTPIGRPFIARDLTAHVRERPRLPAAPVETQSCLALPPAAPRGALGIVRRG